MEENILIDEKNKYIDIYSRLMFAYDDLRNMLDEEELEKRTFISKYEDLKEYMQFLDDLEKESKNKKSFFSKIFNKETDSDKIKKYMNKDKRMKLDKLIKCSKCKCINCVNECVLNSCINCREKEYVNQCDKNKSFMTKSTDTVTLYNGNEEVIFNISGYLVEKNEKNRFDRYVYLIDSKDYDNQHILKYSKLKGEEYYDSIIKDNSQDELIRINNKFIEFGLRV